MFELRQERLDEVFEAEEQLLSRAETRQEQPATVVQPGFQLPTLVWILMAACYAIFLGAMTALAAGSGLALFAILISSIYVVVFFSTSTILANLPGERSSSPLDRGEALPTWCGPMNLGSVYGQVLIVPAGIAFFGVAVAVIGAVTS